MVKKSKRIEKEYALKICKDTKKKLESIGYSNDFVITGGIISKGYSYNDIDIIIILNVPITDDDASVIATILYSNIPEVGHHTILYINKDCDISCRMGIKPELLVLNPNWMEKYIAESETRVIQSYNHLYKELCYSDPILCLKENISKVVTQKKYYFV